MNKNNHLYYYCKKFEDNLIRFNEHKYIRQKIEQLFTLKELTGKNISTMGSLKVFRIGGTARLIIQRQHETELDADIYYIREIVPQEDWVKTVATQVKKGFWLSANPLTEQEKNSAIAYFKNKLSQKEKNVKPKPQTETLWFNDFKFKLGISVYEHEHWVKYTSSRHNPKENILTDDLNLFHDALYTIYHQKTHHNKIKENLYVYQTPKIGILYSHLENSILIYGGANLSIQKEYWESLIAQNLHIPGTIQDMQHLSVRAYPSFVLKPENYEKWKNIQLSRENSNLSLLSEQIEFLQNFRFPSYINGQAGSGKSTMLYYLFANAHFYKKMGQIDGKLLFLTENHELLNISKTEIKSLLLDNPEFETDGLSDFEGFDECFYSFKDFLLSIIPDEDKIKFNPDLYLNFAVFRQKYLNAPLRNRKVSPEEAWFVITTYLRGYGRTVNAENYEQEIPRKSQSVDKSTVQDVEQYVLPFYEELKNQGYWDKIQLIEYIQQKLTTIPKFDLIICDESQDFCRLELQFILKLCKWTEYDLSEVNQIPVVLAGDAHQTVNPTGYRADEVKDLFYNELISLSIAEPKLNWYEPQYNYRSAYPVVQLANKIQYYRKKYFELDIKKPQKAKKDELSTIQCYQNVCIDVKHLQNETLHKKLQYKTFIVPYDDINEKSIPFMKETNVKNPVLAKGADYEQVVLYKFGEYYLNCVKNSKQNSHSSFAEKYFFNKLYVAVTRATTELIVLDTPQAIQEFWNTIKNLKADENSDWREINEYTDLFLCVDTFNNLADSSPNTVREETLQDKARAIEHKDSELLRLCAKQFLRLNDNKEHYECMALAYEFEEKWQDAVTYYQKLNNHDKVWHCYFQAQDLEALEKIKSINGEKNVLRYNILKLLREIQREQYLTISNELDTISRQIETAKQLLENVVWKKEFIQSVSKILSFSYKPNEIYAFLTKAIDILANILPENQTEYDTLRNQMATLCYEKLNDYKKAIQIWHSIQNEDLYLENTLYIHAQADNAKYLAKHEDVIFWYGKLLDSPESVEDKIIQYYVDYENNFSGDIKKEVLFILAKAFVLRYNRELHDQKLELRIVQWLNDIEQKISNFQEQYDFYEELLHYGKLENNLWVFILQRWARAHYKHNQNLSAINDAYKNFSEKQGKNYIPFTETEIQNIPAIIEKISIEFPKHISGITVKNFKRFNDLTIKSLAKINLITGDNNTGKTSLLEALCFNQEVSRFMQYQTYNYLQRTQNLHFDKETGYITVHPEKVWNTIVSKNKNTETIEYHLLKHRYQWIFSITKENAVKDFIKLHKDSLLEHALLVPFGKVSHETIMQFYENHVQGKKQLRNALIQSLKTFIPQIDNITTDEETIIIEEKEQDEGLPLYYYGDGVYRLFYTAMLMLIHPEKRLMIDEVDAGIHFSRLVPFLEALLKISDKSDIQIFATTHNIECLHAIKIALENEHISHLQKETRLITLYQTQNNEIKARVREFEEFAYAVEEGYNVRGGE